MAKNKVGSSNSIVIAFGDDFNDFDMIPNVTVDVAIESVIVEMKSLSNTVT